MYTIRFVLLESKEAKVLLAKAHIVSAIQKGNAVCITMASGQVFEFGDVSLDDIFAILADDDSEDASPW